MKIKVTLIKDNLQVVKNLWKSLYCFYDSLPVSQSKN